MTQQESLWDSIWDRYKITKPIRLIELFSGIGSQFKALKQLTDKVESWKTCEWAYNSIIAYNSIHIKDNTDYAKDMTKEQLLDYLQGNISLDYNQPADLSKKSLEWLKTCYNSCIANHNLMNIMKVKAKDLEIVDKDKYEYIMTYSFPCQDLSLAGNRKGMSESQANGGTRSGLLWEVERLLDELREREQSTLPQILLMENVPQVIGANSIKDFQKWEMKLESLGYQNFIEILNSKDYGIPQNRQRCFMVSILGESTYHFPEKMPLTYKLKDFLENNVDEKYYLSEKFLNYVTHNSSENYDRAKLFEEGLKTANEIGLANSITTRMGRGALDTYITDIITVGNAGNGHHSKDISSPEGLMPTITTGNHNNGQLIMIKNATAKGYEEATIGDGIDISTRMESHRGTVQKGMAQTLTCQGDNNVGVVVEDNFVERKYKEYIEENGEFPEMYNPYNKEKITDVAPTQTTQCGGTTNSSTVLVGTYDWRETDTFRPTEESRIHLGVNESKCLAARSDNNAVILNQQSNLRIRKLTPLECLKLMGFEQKDYESMKQVGLSDMAIYHCAGDSIVVSVIMGIFSNLINEEDDYKVIIENYVKTLQRNE